MTHRERGRECSVGPTLLVGMSSLPSRAPATVEVGLLTELSTLRSCYSRVNPCHSALVPLSISIGAVEEPP